MVVLQDTRLAQLQTDKLDLRLSLAEARSTNELLEQELRDMRMDRIGSDKLLLDTQLDNSRLADALASVLTSSAQVDKISKIDVLARDEMATPPASPETTRKSMPADAGAPDTLSVVEGSVVRKPSNALLVQDQEGWWSRA